MHEQDMAVPEGPRSGLDRTSADSFAELSPERQTAAVYDEFVSRFPDREAGAEAWVRVWAGPELDQSQPASAEAIDQDVSGDVRDACPRSHGLVEMTDDDIDDDTDLIENTLADVADELGWEL